MENEKYPGTCDPLAKSGFPSASVRAWALWGRLSLAARLGGLPIRYVPLVPGVPCVSKVTVSVVASYLAPGS